MSSRRGAKWEGVGERIAMRMRDLGFWNEEDDRPDISEFIAKHAARKYLGQQFYVWFSDGVPDRLNLEALAEDLDCAVAWLLLGKRAIGLKAPNSPPLSSKALAWVQGDRARYAKRGAPVKTATVTRIR